jgi:hypothetical protein
MSRKEPRQLSRGKAFHRLLQSNWASTAQGNVEVEKTITKLSGRRGRIDIIIDAETETVGLIELKHSDWDKMTEQSVKRNVKRQANQLWGYILSQPNEGDGVCPGIIFAQKPQKVGRQVMVEELFWKESVPVYWQEDLDG